jgi:hypothetical protein
MRKISMNTSSTYLFEVIFTEIPVVGVPASSQVGGRSIIVEIDSGSVVETPTSLPSPEAARRYAKELAPQFAMQVVQKDFPHGFEPPYSVMEIDQLPRDLHLHSPKFHGAQFRAWLRRDQTNPDRDLA